MSDFSYKTLRSLLRKGISLIGLQGDAYVLNDNGTCKVRTFSEVLEMAR